MARVSYLRPAGTAERPPLRAPLPAGLGPGGRRSHRGRYIALGVLVLAFALVAAGAILLATSRARLSADTAALAKVELPLGGGTIERVSATTGPHSRPIPVQLRGGEIWPQTRIPAHRLVTVEAVVKRPAAVAWLSGATEHLHLQLLTPSAAVSARYLTLRARAPLRVRFTGPIRMLAYGPPGRLRRHQLGAPQTEVTLPRRTAAGSIAIAAAPRSWETAAPTIISWFPAGAAATAVATPAPGSRISPTTPITLTFNKTVSQALGSARPPVSPITDGTWHTISSHAIVFRPRDYGYGLGATVRVGLPGGVRLVGGSASGGSWTVPGGSPLRLQQLLAGLGYLPLRFSYDGRAPGHEPLAQLRAAIHPPAGRFRWRYPNIPAPLRSFWAPGASGVMMRGALMAFENDHGLVPDGIAGPNVWRTLIAAAVAGHRSPFGYSFVMVSLSSQHLALWHNGRSLLTTAVNTGIASRPTAPGTFPVYEHIRVGTMSGTNPDGSHYHDPGIQFISYFNGGDALHAFTRAQYGFPQSLGCVEMALGPAGQVWPYTPIGTLVHVA